MVRQRRTTIVNPDQIFSNEDIRDFSLSESVLYRNLHDNEKSLGLLASLRIIKNESECEFCNSKMSLVKVKRKQSVLLWNCKLPCRKKNQLLKTHYLKLLIYQHKNFF